MRGLITSIITALAITSLQAQTNMSKPKLVVGLTIDQLSTELIETYWNLYGDNGFRRLWKEGLVYKDTYYPLHTIDRSSASATIVTGTIPYTHGIIANEWLDKSTNQAKSCVYDKDYMGNYTSLSSSANNIMCSTITDELNRENNGSSIIYSIAPTSDMAILLAGHSANGVLWFNPENGKWSSSTYYIDYPAWVSNYNELSSVSFREGDLVWTPLANVEKYYNSNSRFKESFRHILIDGSNERYKKVINSPIINSEIVKLTKDLFKNTEIGQDQTTDYLQLGFSAANPILPNNLSSVEQQDIYLRIDQNIAELLKIIDINVGLHNTLFYITSTGYRRELDEGKNFNIPEGDFYIHRSAALLNLYLIAKYGEGNYISYYSDLQLYLNHSLLENKGLEIDSFQKECAHFLLEISGVQNVYCSTDLLINSLDHKKELVKNSFYKKRTGDLILEIQPGWKVYNSNNKLEQVVSYSAIQAPTIFLGGNFKSQIITTPIDARAIAPTVAKTIRIRAPNAASFSPIF